MQRSISTFSLLFASVSAILGSGWLFSAYLTSLLAGPAALLAWLIGGMAIIVIAFVFAELSAMIPITGSSSRIPLYTHGTIVSFIFSWMIWLSYAALVATEVQAVIQYISFYFPHLAHHSGALTHEGYAAAALLMLLISALNIFSLRWLIRANTLLTILKIIFPIFICLIVLSLFFSSHHLIHPANTRFMPFGWHGVFAAISTGGIVFAFNGFKQACEMAGEAKKPGRALPIAIIGSVILCLAIYLLLQSAFLTSLTPHNFNVNWNHLIIGNPNSPFSSILQQDHLSWLLGPLYLCAIIGPLAAGLMFMNSASRSLYAKSKNGYLPMFLQSMTKQGNPIYAILLNFVFGMLLFAPLPGWDKMVTFLTSLMAISYAIAPICLLTLRRSAPQQARPFRLWRPHLSANLAFIICNLMTYWSGWDNISKISIALLLGFIILLAYHLFTSRGRLLTFNWRAATWIWPYFFGIYIISYLGNFGHGHHVLPVGWDMVVIAFYSIFIMYLAIHFRISDQETQRHLKQLQQEHTLNESN